MEVSKEFLEEHLAALRASKEQLVSKLHQHEGAIAMAMLSLQRLEKEEEEEPNAD